MDIQIFASENHKMGTVRLKPAPVRICILQILDMKVFAQNEEPREQQRHRSDGTESTVPSIRQKPSWPAIKQYSVRK